MAFMLFMLFFDIPFDQTEQRKKGLQHNIYRLFCLISFRAFSCVLAAAGYL